jgi:hypothetical protein
MHQTIQYRGRSYFSGKNFIPSARRQIGGDDEGALFVSLADNLKEKALFFFVHFQVGQLVDDQKGNLL